MGRRILIECEAQDALSFNWFGRARDIVEGAGVEGPYVSAPIRQMRKYDDGNATRGRRQDTHRCSKVAIRQIIIAKDKLKCLPLN